MSEDNTGSQEREERLERELRELAPLILRRQQAEATGVDATFARVLEQRLVGEEATNTGVSTSRATRPARLLIPRPIWTGFAAAALVAAALVLVVLSRQRPSVTTHVAFVPRPTTADLIRNYPSFTVGLGEGGMDDPITSPIVIPGGAYPVRLHLVASHLPASPTRLTAYRLAGASFVAPRTRLLARKLGILAPVAYWNDMGQTAPRLKANWAVATVGFPPSRVPLHSLAISLRTGELLYHDVRSVRQPRVGSGMRPGRAIVEARAWITQLGWPGATMPVLSVVRAERMKQPGTPSPLAVMLGWPGIGRVNVPEAVIWVNPDGRIIEALAWPPVVERHRVPTRDINEAWNRVRAGKAPIALPFAVAVPYPTGTGIESDVGVVNLLVTPSRGAPYLVPTYRFAGRVQLEGGQGIHRWYALVPAPKN